MIRHDNFENEGVEELESRWLGLTVAVDPPDWKHAWLS